MAPGSPRAPTGSVGVDRVERLLQAGRVPEEFHLMLLAHDHALQQVLERLAARLLAGRRDDGVQGGDRLLLRLQQLRQRRRRFGSTTTLPTSAPGRPPRADAFSVSRTRSSVSSRTN
jgi:hypothetical protein